MPGQRRPLRRGAKPITQRRVLATTEQTAKIRTAMRARVRGPSTGGRTGFSRLRNRGRTPPQSDHEPTRPSLHSDGDDTGTTTGDDKQPPKSDYYLVDQQERSSGSETHTKPAPPDTDSDTDSDSDYSIGTAATHNAYMAHITHKNTKNAVPGGTNNKDAGKGGDEDGGEDPDKDPEKKKEDIEGKYVDFLEVFIGTHAMQTGLPGPEICVPCLLPFAKTFHSILWDLERDLAAWVVVKISVAYLIQALTVAGFATIIHGTNGEWDDYSVYWLAPLIFIYLSYLGFAWTTRLGMEEAIGGFNNEFIPAAARSSRAKRIARHQAEAEDTAARSNIKDKDAKKDEESRTDVIKNAASNAQLDIAAHTKAAHDVFVLISNQNPYYMKNYDTFMTCLLNKLFALTGNRPLTTKQISALTNLARKLQGRSFRLFTGYMYLLTFILTAYIGPFFTVASHGLKAFWVIAGVSLSLSMLFIPIMRLNKIDSSFTALTEVFHIGLAYAAAFDKNTVFKIYQKPPEAEKVPPSSKQRAITEEPHKTQVPHKAQISHKAQVPHKTEEPHKAQISHKTQGLETAEVLSLPSYSHAASDAEDVQHRFTAQNKDTS